MAYSAGGPPAGAREALEVPAYTIGHGTGRFLGPRTQFLMPRVPRLEYAGSPAHSTLGRTSPDS
ncbi:hypothetical protein GCM10017752_50500 [Streptomyces roseoviridis]